MKMDRTMISIASSLDDEDSRSYWFQQPPQERLKHVEKLRRINCGHRATERLQGFFEIAQRGES
ncbi:MAG: hypothetical protein HQM12_08160 [SAR324 cluster bacterium]|nr:hypothetical protein [SAR324 cluster bacterium]